MDCYRKGQNTRSPKRSRLQGLTLWKQRRPFMRPFSFGTQTLWCRLPSGFATVSAQAPQPQRPESAGKFSFPEKAGHLPPTSEASGPLQTICCNGCIHPRRCYHKETCREHGWNIIIRKAALLIYVVSWAVLLPHVRYHTWLLTAASKSTRNANTAGMELYLEIPEGPEQAASGYKNHIRSPALQRKHRHTHTQMHSHTHMHTHTHTNTHTHTHTYMHMHMHTHMHMHHM